MSLFDDNPLRQMMGQMRADMNPLAGIMPRSSGPSAPYRRPLPPWEADELGQDWRQWAMSGLSYVGSVLDKPGRAVRGVLGGKPGEALAALPFSDSLGLTDPKNQVSGAQLLDKTGLTSPQNDSWGRMLGGIGVEMLTDPTMMVGGLGKNALTKTGSALDKTGALRNLSRTQLTRGPEALESVMKRAGKASEFEHLSKSGHFMGSEAMEQAAQAAGRPLQANEPMIGAAKIGLPILAPFGIGPSATVGTGLAKQMAPTLDKIGDKLLYSKLGQAASAVFSPRVMGATDEVTQRAARAVGHDSLKGWEATFRDRLHPVMEELSGTMKANPGVEPGNLLAHVFGVGETGRALTSIGMDPGITALARPIADKMKAAYGEALKAGQELGVPMHEFQDKFSQYMHRELSAHPGSPGIAETQSRIFNPGGASFQKKRLDAFRDLPGGQFLINKLTSDAALIGKERPLKSKAAAARVYKLAKAAGTEQGTTFGRLPKPATGTLKDEKLREAYLKALSPEQRATWDLQQKAREVARKLRSYKEPGQLFSTDAAGTLQHYGPQFAGKYANTNALIQSLSKGAREFVQGDMPLDKALGKLGLRSVWGNPETGEKASGAAVELFKRMYDTTGQLVDPLLGATKKEWKAKLSSYGIDPKTWNDISKQYAKARKTTEQIAGPMKLLGQTTNVSKNMLYSMWLPSHIRNWMSGEWNNLLEGVGLADRKKAWDLVRGNLPPAEQQQLSRQMFGAGNVFSGMNQTEELAGGGGRAIQHVPGMREPTGRSALGDVAAKTAEIARETQWNPIKARYPMQGVQEGAKDFPLLAGMKGLGTEVENYLRSAHMISAMRQGFSPEEAARRMMRVHFDYSPSGATHIERAYVKQLFPFWTFMSRNLPYQAGQVLHNPGRVMAQARPFTNRDPKEFVPEYLQSGVSLPLSPEENGKQQFLGQLGLPFEEAFERLAMKGGMPDIPKTAMRYMAGMNPLLAGPLQYVTGKQFYSGRNLADLRPPAGLGEVLNPETATAAATAIGMTPLSRFVTAADRLTDPRKTWWQKALNLGTGVRVTDVDMDKLRAVETRQQLMDLTKRSPHLAQYTEVYPKANERWNLTPDEVQNLRMLSYLQQQARQFMARQGLAGQ